VCAGAASGGGPYKSKAGRAEARPYIGKVKGEERFLAAQADHFAGVKWEEKVGLLRSE